MFSTWFSTKRGHTSPFVLLVQELATCTGAIERVAPEDYWLKELHSFQERAASYTEQGQAVEWNQLGKDIVGIYGAMGSFNDNMYPNAVREQQNSLYIAAENVVRCTRKELGGTWFDIPATDQLKVGDEVKLIKGQVISLLRDETPQMAPQSPMIYKVISLLTNDVDNMPRYHIKADSHVRYARHNALRKATSP